uniref:Transcriptional corepressor LEUNIG_HOMOLOG-like isoform X1 n=1 Tax=Nicotiana tabacum TaxID=4097 RepID=A0A1S4D4R8_TOBAC|nr:PREDICTED: transcriptional corepressor LEUNIG_HOMOLOG-like isoform X1 [Nicotiana tabacum]
MLGLCLAVILDLAFSSSTFLLLSRLEVVILNYMVKRGFHQTCEVFAREINANPNHVAINSPEGYLQEWWNIFYEAFSSRFPEVALFAAESFDKVSQTVENVVSNIGPVSSIYAPNHTGENISTVTTSSPMMPSPHLMASSPVMASSGPDLMDPYISDLLSSICPSLLPNLSPPMASITPEMMPTGGDVLQNGSSIMPRTGYIQPSFTQFSVGPNIRMVQGQPSLDLLPGRMQEQAQNMTPPRDVTSILKFLEINKMDGVLPSASNSGYPMHQIPTVLPQWEGRGDRRGINLEGPMQMEPNLYLPPWPEHSDAGNNRSLQQASHQGCPLVDVLPEVAVQTLDELNFPAPSSSGDFNRMLIQAGSSGKHAGILGDKNKRTLENLPVDQQILAPTGGKQIAVQEQVNQLRLQSSNKRGRKRKASLSSLAAVGKEKATTDGISSGNINSYFSQGDAGLIGAFNSISALGKSIAACIESDRKGISIKEIGSLHATHSELLSCHFHSQGKLLAAAGHEVVIWDLENNDVNTGEGHAHLVTDIRFKPNSTVFATSSFDRTVMIWDAAKPSNPFQKLLGHADHVMSLDFHPTKVGLLSSCDSNDEIRLWDVSEGDCKLIFKGGSRQVRFQPRFGNLLACSTGNIINIFDVETNSIQQQLQGHVGDVRSICWDMSGNFLASVSEDSARIWCVSGRKCLHELRSSGNKFQSCTFHPDRAQLLAIGSHELLELWNPMYQSHRTWPHQAHDGIISSFADSPPTGTIASVSHDQYIKIWQ